VEFQFLTQLYGDYFRDNMFAHNSINYMLLCVKGFSFDRLNFRIHNIRADPSYELQSAISL